MEVYLYSNQSEFDYYSQGVSFQLAADRCFGERGVDGQYIIAKDGKFVQLTAPTVVNGAFACEMFFKAILKHFNLDIPKGKDGHNLRKLFSLIPTQERKIISNFCFGENSEKNFEKLLDIHAEDFVHVRYFIQKTGFREMSPMVMQTLSFNLMNITKYILNEKREKGEEHE